MRSDSSSGEDDQGSSSSSYGDGEGSASDQEGESGASRTTGNDRMQVEEDDDEGEGQGQGQGQGQGDKSGPRATTEPTSTTNASSSPFLDAFYGLASQDPRQRAAAAKEIFHYSLLGPDRNVKDAAYAFSRLLNGLGSGRACARQGNAGALASFLRITMLQRNSSGDGEKEEEKEDEEEEGSSSIITMKEIIREDSGGDQDKDRSSSSCPLAYVRERLLAATVGAPPKVAPRQKNRRAKGGGGSSVSGAVGDDRDAKLGLLFGVLAMVRSGVIVSASAAGDDRDDDDYDYDDATGGVAIALALDLVGLYQDKKHPWLKEPTAHAVMALLNVASASGSSSLVAKIVEGVVLPGIVASSAKEKNPTGQYDSPEELAVLLYVQALYAHKSIPIPSQTVVAASSLPALLSQPVLTLPKLPGLVPVLTGMSPRGQGGGNHRSSSASAHQPRRMHLVWDALIFHLTRPLNNNQLGQRTSRETSSRITIAAASQEASAVNLRAIRSDLDDDAWKLVEGIIRLTCEKREQHLQSKKSPLESCRDPHRRAFAAADSVSLPLALSLLRIFGGVEFTSSITGWTRLVVVDPMVLERHILVPPVVRACLVNPLAGCSSWSSSSSPPRTWVLEFLDALERSFANTPGLETAVVVGGKEEEEASAARDRRMRLAIARALLRCDPRFDARTRTRFVARLVHIDEQLQYGSDPSFFRILWGFVLQRVVASSSSSSDSDAYGSADAAVEDVVADQQSDLANGSVTPHAAQGYLDLALSWAKAVVVASSSTRSDEPGSRVTALEIIQHILDGLLPVAFFDCRRVHFQGGKKKGKPRQLPPTGATDAALLISRTAPLPTAVRETASSRFFSILSLGASSFSPRASAGNEKPAVPRASAAAEILSAVLRSADALEEAGAVMFMNDKEKRCNGDGFHGKDISSWLRRREREVVDKHQQAASEPLRRCVAGFLQLGMTLRLALFETPGSTVDFSSTAGEARRRDVAAELLMELKDCCKLFLKTKDEGDDDVRCCPLSNLSSLCVDALSSPLNAPAPALGAYPTLLRDAVKGAWASALALCDDAPERYCRNPNAVVDGLLDAVGVPPDVIDEEDGEEEHLGSFDESEGNDAEESENDDSDLDTDGDHYAEKVGAEEVSGDDDDDGGNKDGDDDEEEQLDPERLRSLLEDEAAESGGSNTDFELEHHDGADAALARFLQAKQDSRKAGQAALQREAFRTRIRCVILLEALFVSGGKNPNRGRMLLTADRCIRLIVRLLALRKALERLLADRSQHAASTTTKASETRDLLERITSLLRSRLFRSKFLTGPWDPSAVENSTELLEGISRSLMADLRGRASKEHRQCTGLGLLAVLRATPDFSVRLRLASASYGEAVAEWSSKRTTRLESAVFEEFIQRDPVLACGALVSPLARSACEARTAFLKAESCRLIAKLYGGVKLSGGCNADHASSSSSSSAQQQVLTECLSTVLDAYVALLRDKELRRVKRLREVLKSLPSVLDFASASSASSASVPFLPPYSVSLAALGDALEDLRKVCLISDHAGGGSSSSSPAVRELCDRLLQKLSAGLLGLGGGGGGGGGGSPCEKNEEEGKVAELASSDPAVADAPGQSRHHKKRKKGKRGKR